MSKMEFGKFFKNRQKIIDTNKILDILCKTLYPDYSLEESIRKQFEPTAQAIVSYLKED